VSQSSEFCRHTLCAPSQRAFVVVVVVIVVAAAVCFVIDPVRKLLDISSDFFDMFGNVICRNGTTNQFHAAVLLEKVKLRQENSPPFMEPESSLPC